MIEYVNKHNIPEALAIAIEQSANEYTAGEVTPFFSASKANMGVKEFYCSKELNNSKKVYYKDLKDMFYLYVGNAIHAYTEQMILKSPNADRFKTEQRMYVNIVVDGKTYVIGGQFDCLDTLEGHKTLIDYKTASIAKYTTGLFEDYELQANIYLYMLRRGYIVKDGKLISLKGFGIGYKASLNFILRDWSVMRSNGYNYPDTGFAGHTLRVWTDEEIENTLTEQVKKLLVYEDTPLDDIPPCTMEQRWQDVDRYPVFLSNKDGSHKAREVAVTGTKLFASEDEAVSYIQQQRVIATTKAQLTRCSLLYVGYRKSEPTRCLMFCDAGRCGVCNWLNNWKKDNA